MSDFNMPEQLWDLANLVTGFAIVQTLATTFTVLKGELKVLKGLTAHWLAVAGTIFFLLCYVAAIWWCGDVGSSLDAGHSHVWRVVTFGRIVGVILFTAVALVVIWGHRRDEVSNPR
jgi:hypothetical protein